MRFFAERLDQKRAQLSVGSSSEVSLKVSETDLSNLTATIRSPSGMEEPCALKRLANGHLGISFTPRETGEHLVNVYRCASFCRSLSPGPRALRV